LKRFLLGLLLGLLPLGGLLGYQAYQRGRDPCRGHCASSTTCMEGSCVALGRVEPVAPQKARRTGRGRRAAGAGAGRASAEAELRRPSAAEAALATEGPAVGGTEYVNLAGKEQARELTSEEVDSRFRALDERIVACIDRARAGVDVGGHTVTVRFRVERSGHVEKVQVAAPSVMQRAGLTGCVRPLVAGLRFEASGRALVMSYPFKLR